MPVSFRRDEKVLYARIDGAADTAFPVCLKIEID